MAHSPVAIAPRWPGATASVLVVALVLGPLLAVALRAEWQGGLSPADWSAVRFTITQALVSAFLSVVLAIPVARALSRRSFRGRTALVTLLGAPFLLPVIVAIVGLIAVFGRNGVINTLLVWLGLPDVSIYGFQGVVLAHVFFNLPLATRLILQGWLAIPAERFRLAATLGAPVGRLLEWPMLRSVAPGAFLVIFLICLTSFAVALTLGGGPRATTIELAIYQSLRFDFDLGKAALLSCLQFGICTAAAVIAWKLTTPDAMGTGLDRVVQRFDKGSLAGDVIAIALAMMLVLLPLFMVIWRGLPGLPDLPLSVWQAAARSLVVAAASAALCVALATALALWSHRIVGLVGVLPLAASSLVVGTGGFLIVFPFISPTRVALLVTVLVNATFAMPFVLRAIQPAVQAVQADYGRLGASLDMSRAAWLRLVVLPRIRQPLGFGAGLAAALSMGDLGVITLFASDAQETLPLAMYRLMGAYRMEAAAGSGVLLLCLSFALFWICDRGGRGSAGL